MRVFLLQPIFYCPHLFFFPILYLPGGFSMRHICSMNSFCLQILFLRWILLMSSFFRSLLCFLRFDLEIILFAKCFLFFFGFLKAAVESRRRQILHRLSSLHQIILSYLIQLWILSLFFHIYFLIFWSIRIQILMTHFSFFLKISFLLLRILKYLIHPF